MRSFLFTLLVQLIFISSSFTQVLDPVKWTFSTEQISATEYVLVFTADMEKTWTVYSQFTGDDGPVPTYIEYEEMGGATLSGDSKESGHKKEGFDKLFETNVIKFLDDKPYVIKQKVSTDGSPTEVSGYLTFMTCDAARCLPPKDVDFNFQLGGGAQQMDSKPASTTETTNTSEVSSISGVSGIDNGNQAEKATKKKGILNPVTWDFKIDDLGNGMFNLIYNAKIDDEWTVYSQFTSDDGPVPTTIEYEALNGASLEGESIEKGHRKEGPDALFDGVNVIKFLGDEDFSITQKVKAGNGPIKGYLTYMTCDAERCLPPKDVDFMFDPASGKAFDPTKQKNTGSVGTGANIKGDVLNQNISKIQETFEKPIGTCGEAEVKKSEGLWGIFIGGFLGGLLAILLPCIFPMIPITVSFFTKGNNKKGWVNGLIYGLSIIIIFVGLGLAVTALLGPEALNKLSVNSVANVLFFVIFVAFAISFFGYFEIALPSSWSTKTDAMADKGGLLGTFFMAATLAIVSFSCTGPLIGTAIVQVASSGSYLGPAAVMLGFSTALAIPFGLFAAFPSWLNSLPRSGSWMTSVKVVLGFLELALALKFLSVADMTSHWGWLRYEVFLGLWVLIGIAMSLYLLGFIRFPHDPPKAKLTPIRWGFALLSIAVTIYLALGFRYNDEVKSYHTPAITSGLAPPATYNFFLPAPELDKSIKDRYPSFTKCANNIDCFKDYYEGLAYAKEVNKPMFVDFTGYGCVNCRKTEEHIWVDPAVRKSLNDDYVLVSLYVDDKKKLDKTYLAIRDEGKVKVRTVGSKWADFQIANFKSNAQPLYIPMSNNQEVLLAPRAYQEGIAGYLEYMNCGLEANKNLK